jgi:hypothetical protein
LALRLVEFVLLDPIAAPDPCPASNVRLHTSGRTRSRPKRQPANQHNNERAHHAASEWRRRLLCTHGHPAAAVDVFIFVWLTAGKQQNRATKDSTRLFSRFTFIICAAHAVGHLFRERGVHSVCAAAGWLASPLPQHRPTGIMESRRAVSQSVRRAASAGLTRRLSERRRHSTCPAPNNGPRRTNPRLNTHLITARPPLMALESKNKEFHSRTRKQGAKKRASERRRRPKFLTPPVCDPILAVCGAARRKIMAT